MLLFNQVKVATELSSHIIVCGVLLKGRKKQEYQVRSASQARPPKITKLFFLTNSYFSQSWKNKNKQIKMN